MITHIKTVAVDVDDQNRALEFWRDKMGFERRAGREYNSLLRHLTLLTLNDLTSL